MPTSAQIVEAAETWLGVRYLYGGGRGTTATARSAGVDCSGLTYQIFSAFGENIGTDTVSQFNNPAGQVIPNLSSAQAGDLVFFGSPVGGTQEHVGIYIGNDLMIDAPHTGSSVRIDRVSTFGENILGIRRFTTGVVSATTAGVMTSDPTDPYDPAVASPSSSSGLSGSLTRVLVEATLVAGALGLVVLGVLRSTKGTP